MLVGLIGWQVFLPNSVQERITMTYTEEGELESSAQTRVQLWEDAMQLFHQNPILGTGFNTYSYLGRTEKYRDTHNYYLKVLVETGIVGLLVFLWLLCGCSVLASGSSRPRRIRSSVLSAWASR